MMHRLPDRMRAALAGRVALAAFAMAAGMGAGHAGPTAQVQVTASSELPNDEMVVHLAVDRTGTAAEKLNDEVLEALNLALAKARRVDGVKARLGSITTQPEWGPQGKRTGWRVRGVVVLEGRDLRATGALAGDLSADLQISGVSFQLTRAARAREESRLLKEAAAAFNERARDTAAAFGFSSFEVKHLNVNHAQGEPPRPMQMERRASVASNAMVPTQGGEATVTLSIDGTVELK
ncbi:MAG TPA: SIMPL domain-containing protein [Lautropia sp.]|nr:SIMPL domain-containing protein [Lautropia sp.]